MLQIGLRIAEVRERKGLTQELIAELMRRSPRWVQYVESGTVNLSIDKIAHFGDVLGVDVFSLCRRPTKKTIRNVGRPAKRR